MRKKVSRMINNKIPTITVFGDDKGEIVQRFLDTKYDPLVDAVNGGNYVFLSNNYAGPHRFYCLDENDSSLVEYYDPEVPPDFCIAFNVDTEVEDEEWKKIFEWLTEILIRKNLMEIEIFEHPIHQTAKEEEALLKTEKAEEDFVKENYEFRFEVVGDTIFYEVWKPNTDRPYTSVVEDFSKVGHEQFFSSLFVCDSWGVGKDDYTFLKVLWDHLKMSGVYDLERMVSDHVEECKNGKPEPRVYRKSLSEVVKMFTEVGSKRKFQDDERRPKMLVLK